ncbi:MAG: 2-oxo-4-hydroxy-4-carboxy-5-ureidoimidazoline decarboxylase [Verrucomicrobiota bacterium]
MISLAQLNAASAGEFVSALGGIYEHSDWVPRRIIQQRPFRDPEHLGQAMRQAVDQAADEEKLTLIRAHPDLAGKLARAGALTEESTREQAGLGLDRLSDAEYEEFSTKNEGYREKFGFPFIICARLTTKQGVLDAFGKRLENQSEEEISEALFQIHQIARLRLEDLVAG